MVFETSRVGCRQSACNTGAGQVTVSNTDMHMLKERIALFVYTSTQCIASKALIMDVHLQNMGLIALLSHLSRT